MVFRDRFQDLLIDRLALVRRPADSIETSYKVLSNPHPNSPFLTLAEWIDPAHQVLPAQVIKILLVLDRDPSFPSWREILEGECKRWREELEYRLQLPAVVARLALPLPPPVEGSEPLARVANFGPLRRSDLLAEDATETPDANISFPFLLRPFIPWPRLSDVSYSTAQLRQRWHDYCLRHRLPDHLRKHPGVFQHFCDEALVHDDDLLLTSAWRLRHRSRR